MVTVLRANQNGGVPVMESDDDLGDGNDELDVNMFHSKK
jgi:hypothetical protein